MTIEQPRKLPPPAQRLINADGTMNEYWRKYFEEWDTRLRQLIDASNDHETRITALEP
jgi:hypothetical protein